MINPLKLDLRNLAQFKRPPGASLLGLAFDGSRLEGVAVRRTNGAAEIKQTFAASLSLDLLTNEPELVGREIRKHLDAAGVRERRCAVCVPLDWAFTQQVKLPDLPEADLQSLLQLEAERGFPCGLETLLLATSRFQAPGGERYATLVAIPRHHLARLEAVLQAAQLRPVSFSLGIAALQPAGQQAPAGVLALAAGENSLSLQISCGGGVAVLRTVEGAFELEGGEKRLQADQVARETRITLGQLPADVRAAVRQLRVFGGGDTAEELAEQLAARVDSLGLQAEQVKSYPSDQFGIELPADTAVSPALSLALRLLAGQAAELEFLPPKISRWRQFAARYSSRKLAWVGAGAGAVALVIALAFLVQQAQLTYWRSKWKAIGARVTEIENMQQQTRRFRPWFDESCRSLSILRRLTEAFPEDGAVAAKTVEIRETAEPRGGVTVTCSGTARDYPALLRTKEQLAKAKEAAEVHLQDTRGQSPMQFTFNFQWRERGSP
jgi:hypothetical protein